MLRFEQGILQSNERMRVINFVLLQQPLFYKRGTLKRSQFQINYNTRDFCCVVYGGVSATNCTSMVDPQTKTYDGKISGNILVPGSTAGEKTAFVQKLSCNSMFGKLEGVHWISQVRLSEQREAKIDSSFEPKVEFYRPQHEYDLKKTFSDLENLYKERVEKNKIVQSESSGMGEYVERDSLIVLDDVSGLADKSPSFVTFMTLPKIRL